MMARPLRTLEAAPRAVASAKPQGILLDVMFGSNRTDRLGVDILRELTRKHPEIPVVMMTSVARDELWAECARLGAVDYPVKPMSDRLMSQTLHRHVGVEMKHWLIGQNKHFLDAINLVAMAAEGKERWVFFFAPPAPRHKAASLPAHGKRAP